MKDNRNIFVGSKFFRFTEESQEPEIIRIHQIIKERVKYFDKNGIVNSMSKDYLFDNYKLLTPDGIIMAVIVKMGEVKDTIVTLWKMNDSDKSTPYAICRQLVDDVFTNNIKKSEYVRYVGLSISTKTCPGNINFNSILSCDSIEYRISLAIYLDDTLDTILSLFNNKRFDEALVSASQVPNNNDYQYIGFNDTLRGLLTNNNFMYDFRQCFEIVEIPFKIDEESEALSTNNILFLEDLLKVNIMETYVIRYTKEINLNTIKRDYILVSSAEEEFNNVYIVGYDTFDGEYVPRSTIQN